ncbi:MAG: dihydrodipicolinate synthase family protein [Bacteroidales bacterium]|jgi:4-hydroxy-2-oxoglutarate aldolase|nr:dihydrodipicolinate synthase family protein [Bacteroidales bacterium]
MSHINLSGIFPPLPTSFDKYENLLPEKIKQNIARLSEFDLSGFLILGSNGEQVMLSDREKSEAIAAARAALPDGRLLLAGTGGQSTRETIALTRDAAAEGADAVLVLNPFYFKSLMTHEALVKHYLDVADASTVPVIVYNMPGNTGLDMTPAMVIEMASHPNIIGMKESGGNVAKMGEVLLRAKPGFQVLAGGAGFLLPALATGAVGGILALANIAPSECIRIFRAFKERDMTNAMRLQHMMIPLNAAVTARWGVPALKAAMDYLGLYGGPARKPLLPLNDEVGRQLINLITESGITKFN